MGGRDKGLLLLHGQPLVSYAIRLLRPQVGELLISANRHLAEYQALGWPVVSDSIGEFYGPLAGMLAALEVAAKPYVLSVPCDSPLLPADYADRMYTALLDASAELSVAWDGRRLQPVFALLKTELRDSLRRYLAAGERKIDRWFAQHRLAQTDFAATPAMFRNINTPEELAAMERDLPQNSATICPAPPAHPRG
jgi:molybdenum cofactor guanylyltransferase